MKIKRTLSVIILALVVVFALCACSPGAPKYETTKANYVVSEDALKSELDAFIVGREVRTPFSDGEKKAAEYLSERLSYFGYDPGITEFVSTENSVTQQSQNVWTVYPCDDAKEYIILGAYYDNSNGLTLGGKEKLGGDGAIANGTGVATLLCVADYLQTNKPSLGYNVIIAFFGASAVGITGADEFYKSLDKDVRANTVLMVELQRLGVDNVYAYCDNRTTAREQLFDSVAEQNGYNIHKVSQKSPPITSLSTLNGLPFYQWAHTGVFQSYFNRGIPTLNIVGANWETLDLTDTESANFQNVAFTSEDTLTSLKANYPDHASKMALAASFLIKSMESDGFLDAVVYDKANFTDTSVVNKRWIWYLVVLGIIAIGVAVMTLVDKRLTKKHPLTAPKPKKIKVAVFGLDYENKDPDSIYIDVKPSAQSPDFDIFPGIKNNGVPPVFMQDDPFASPFDIPTAPTTESPSDTAVAPEDEKNTVDAAPDPFDLSGNATDGAIDPTEKGESASGAPVPDEHTDTVENSGAAADKTRDGGKGKTTRKTVSAGKSKSAGKTTRRSDKKEEKPIDPFEETEDK